MKLRTLSHRLSLLLPLYLLAGCGDQEKTATETTAETGGSASTSTGTTPSGSTETTDPHAGDLLVDDFEDGNGTSALGTDWYSYTDADNGGASELTFTEKGGKWVMDGKGYQSTAALSVSYAFDKGSYEWEPFIGFGVSVPPDVSVPEFEGISYAYRGGAHTVRVETSDVKDYDFFSIPVAAASDWTVVKVPFSALMQQGYGKVVRWKPENVFALSWHATGSTGNTATLELDDIYLEDTVEVERGEANLEVKPPAPPTKVSLPTIAITNPLQAKALQYLDKGYNFTNWLEEGRFASFKYDEADVQALAAAGFRSLRLPIDLDLYITARTGSGANLQLTLHDDLFTILDNFNDWTKAAGLSLTIDYHQYDKSLDLDDEASVAETVALWKAVAQHFAAEPRSDLFYELMNEPELSVGATAILSPEPWTAAATQMMEAIRASDATHTIIFGDVNWYGIDQLSARTPFADPNVIYAFHFYDPFIFTHQGATWASQGTTHGVPYPYTEASWSAYGSDFGLSASNPTWVWSLYRRYAVDGTYEAQWNRIAKVKSWAVANNVPIICNEFGAYDRTALEEDRLRYYTDLIDIFEKLEVPWQHWFMEMDAQGKVPAGMADALNLTP